VVVTLALLACSPVPAQQGNRPMKDVTLWYEAFNRKDGAKRLLAERTTAFPDLAITIKEILQDGNKVTVRSEIAGTQREVFLGFQARDRPMAIQAIDIHEFDDGRIIRTWHTEDWLTGLHQLGVFEK
jgi:predicted ester cyclase